MSRFTVGGGSLSATKLYGAYVGVVTDAGDPTGKGRVKVRLASMAAGDSSLWASVCKPFGLAAGSPQIGAHVAVMFEAGDPNYPIVLGKID